MKKMIKTNTVIAAVCILCLALLVFPLSTFAKGGKGGKKGKCDSLIYAFEGDIEGLEFDFGNGFTLNFGAFEATITSVEVQASGQETAAIIASKQFIYNAILSEGGLITADAILYMGEDPMDVTLEFEFSLANIFEQFKIKKKDIPRECEDLLNVTTPKKVDLFFEVTDVKLIPPEWLAVYENVPSFNLVLVIDKGKPALVDTFEFSTMP